MNYKQLPDEVIALQEGGQASIKSWLRRLRHVDLVSGIIGSVLVEDGDQPLYHGHQDVFAHQRTR